jgi:hypothetical protein
MSTSLLRHRRRELALRLLERRLRTTPACLLTGLPEAEIRTLYRMLHGQSPPSGPMPTSCALFPTRRAQARVSVFAALYRRIGGNTVFRTVDAQVLMNSYDLFQDFNRAVFESVPDSPGTRFDFTDAWVIARDLRSGVALLQHCPSCRVDYLLAEGSDLPPTCPFCALRKERKRQRLAK